VHYEHNCLLTSCVLTHNPWHNTELVAAPYPELQWFRLSLARGEETKEQQHQPPWDLHVL
jgi:hypothetical protein